MIRTLIESVTGYPGLMFACAASGILLPLPEDFPLLYAGMRIADGSWGWWATITVALVGVAVRDALAWTLGRAVGDMLLRREGFRRWLGGRGIDRAQRLISRHGASAVLLGRFMIGFRTPVFAVAGAMGVPLRAFATWDALGAGRQPLADAAFLVLQRTRLIVALLVVATVAMALWRLQIQRAAADERESAP